MSVRFLFAWYDLWGHLQHRRGRRLMATRKKGTKPAGVVDPTQNRDTLTPLQERTLLVALDEGGLREIPFEANIPLLFVYSVDARWTYVLTPVGKLVATLLLQRDTARKQLRKAGHAVATLTRKRKT